MDPVSQAVLGGAVGYIVAGKKAPRKAIIAGMTLAILPDLDIFISYENDLDSMTYHRSWTHSWIVHTLLAPLFAWVIWYFDKTLSYSRWLAIVWLAWMTHAGLDALTVFGTQLFWPFMPPPASINSIFIIDPLFTLPLLAGCGLLVWNSSSLRNHHIMIAAIIFSHLYLVWGLAVQGHVDHRVQQSLQANGISSQKIMITPTPLNSILWRVLVMDQTHYYEGFYSLLDGKQQIHFERFDRGMAAQEFLSDLDSYQRMRWFNDGFYRLAMVENDILATDLRMGSEPYYFFTFKLAELSDGEVIPVQPEQIRTPQPRVESVRWAWQRIWQSDLQPISVESPH
ncbi:metal-dependent hydrolase [Methylophaga lonarensis]|uniref:metal-dependent hydrolase n=1 Tax=Methylophaga lonarensis TaxID=999151 RepID=UPI003D293C15